MIYVKIKLGWVLLCLGYHNQYLLEQMKGIMKMFSTHVHPFKSSLIFFNNTPNGLNHDGVVRQFQVQLTNHNNKQYINSLLNIKICAVVTKINSEMVSIDESPSVCGFYFDKPQWFYPGYHLGFK